MAVCTIAEWMWEVDRRVILRRLPPRQTQEEVKKMVQDAHRDMLIDLLDLLEGKLQLLAVYEEVVEGEKMPGCTYWKKQLNRVGDARPYVLDALDAKDTAFICHGMLPQVCENCRSRRPPPGFTCHHNTWTDTTHRVETARYVLWLKEGLVYHSIPIPPFYDQIAYDAILTLESNRFIEMTWTRAPLNRRQTPPTEMEMLEPPSEKNFYAVPNNLVGH